MVHEAFPKTSSSFVIVCVCVVFVFYVEWYLQVAFLLFVGCHPCFWIFSHSLSHCQKQACDDSHDDDPNADVLLPATDGRKSSAMLTPKIIIILKNQFHEGKKNNVFLFHRDSLEASQKILELNKKVEKVREDIYRLPGIEMNKEEQLAKMQNLKQKKVQQQQ